MNDFMVKPIAEKVYVYRVGHGIDGTDDNDWEIAVEYLNSRRHLALENYLGDVFTNRLGTHGVRPLIPKGY